MIKLKENLEFKVSNVGYIIVIGIVLNLTLTIFLTFNSSTFTSKIETVFKEEIVLNDKKAFNKNDLVKLLKKYNVPFPHIVLAQAKLETRNFTSDIFIENSNMFGMKKAYQRSRLAIGVNRGHATYANWEHSLFDYLIFQAKYLSKAGSDQEYVEKLNFYAEDVDYREKVLSLSKNLKELF